MGLYMSSVIDQVLKFIGNAISCLRLTQIASLHYGLTASFWNRNISFSISQQNQHSVAISKSHQTFFLFFSLWNCQQNYQTGIIADLPTSILSYLYLFLTVYTWQRRWCFTRFHLHLILKLGRWGKIFGKAQVEN